MTLVIINPMSGPGRGSIESRGRDRRTRAEKVLRDAGVPHRVEVTTAPGHGAALARQARADNCALVCAWGGDGTVNEIASVLAFSPIPLAILPNGSGNGLARELGVTLDPVKALRQALTGVDRQLDAGEIGGHLFFNVAGLGFDAHVARLFNERGKRRGFSAYIVTSFIELFRYKAHRYVITLPADDVVRREALMVVIANTAQYGNGARIAPHARPDDGRLDLVVVESQSPAANVWRARKLFDGSLGRAAGVTTRAIDRAEIVANGASSWFHVDGEPVRATEEQRSAPRATALREVDAREADLRRSSPREADPREANQGEAGRPQTGEPSPDESGGEMRLRVKVHPRALRVRVPA